MQRSINAIEEDRQTFQMDQTFICNVVKSQIQYLQLAEFCTVDNIS